MHYWLNGVFKNILKVSTLKEHSHLHNSVRVQDSGVGLHAWFQALGEGHTLSLGCSHLKGLYHLLQAPCSCWQELPAFYPLTSNRTAQTACQLSFPRDRVRKAGRKDKKGTEGERYTKIESAQDRNQNLLEPELSRDTWCNVWWEEIKQCYA